MFTFSGSVYLIPYSPKEVEVEDSLAPEEYWRGRIMETRIDKEQMVCSSLVAVVVTY
jgi:hypothetical protein